MTADKHPRERWCPSCKMRFAVPFEYRNDFSGVKFAGPDVAKLKRGAQMFDEISDQHGDWLLAPVEAVGGDVIPSAMLRAMAKRRKAS